MSMATPKYKLCNLVLEHLIHSKLFRRRRTISVSFFVLLAMLAFFFTIPSAQAKPQAQYDGPAELPVATVDTAMADTPSSGSIISVNSGGNLQSALNNAQCGDIIELQAGATFSGQFMVPAKNCDATSWIIIRTSASDSALPAEGARLTPCYAGVASLEGRPQYTCNNPHNVTAKVEMQGVGDGPFQLANGANFYRFIGLEVTRAAGSPGFGRLVTTKGTADHIIVDRSWLHGGTQDNTYEGVSLNGVTNGAVIDSYFSDFHCVSGAQCVESYAIAGGVSDTQDGPFKIQGNFLEAAGESIMFGGGAATKSPSDIEILNNHFFKPWQWMPGSSNFIGGTNHRPFIVKNHLELKNAVRVLVDSNLMENVWGGFSQAGFSILLTPKNQHQGGKNVCPSCEVTDVTVRFTHVSHAGGGLQLATSISGDGQGGGDAQAGTRWSIHDLVLDDISSKYIGSGTAFQIGNGWRKNPLNTVTIAHVTAFPDSQTHMMIAGNLKSNPEMYAFVFTNNLVVTGEHPVWNAGGGRSSCAFKDVPITTIEECFANSTFANNGLIASPSNYPPSSWPANNLFAQTAADVDFTAFNDGNGGNYELLSKSPFKNKGTDGKDLGADIDTLNQDLAGVE
jgi:hypothetical protein